MRQLILKDKVINQESDCYVIAEIGHNHQGDLNKCLNIIKEAKKTGVSAVKLLKRNNRKLFTKEFYEQTYNSEHAFGKTYGEHREYLEFEKKDFVEIIDYCKSIDVDFLCTAFDKDSLDFLIDINIGAIKFASADLFNIPLLEYGASKKIPIILSTGGANIDDVDRAKKTINQYHDNLVILQCTASYPCSPEDLNLKVIELFLEKYPSNLSGLSSHHNGIAMDLVAYVLGARVIEKHFTLDRALKGSDHSFSLEPQGMYKLIRDLSRAKAALGKKEKIIFPNEKKSLLKMRKKIVASKNLEINKIIEMDDLDYKSPGDGMQPFEYKKLLGKKLIKSIKEDEKILIEYVE